MEKAMKIPKSFQVFGETITIRYDSKQLDDHDAWGRWVSKENTITLMENGLPDDKMQKIFWHEVAHVIFDKLRFHDLAHKENEEYLVEIIGQIMNQIINSFKY